MGVPTQGYQVLSKTSERFLCEQLEAAEERLGHPTYQRSWKRPRTFPKHACQGEWRCDFSKQDFVFGKLLRAVGSQRKPDSNTHSETSLILKDLFRSMGRIEHEKLGEDAFVSYLHSPRGQETQFYWYFLLALHGRYRENTALYSDLHHNTKWFVFWALGHQQGKKKKSMLGRQTNTHLMLGLRAADLRIAEEWEFCAC